MTDITNKSGILPWDIEKIQDAPAKTGVYVLRTATDLGSIIYVGSSENLQQRLREHFSSGEIPNVVFFDWYETNDLNKAISIERIWVEKYSPKFNTRIA